VILPSVLLATGVSLAGLGWLAATDPKRRRAFRLPRPERRRAAWGWTGVLAPGALAAALGGAGGFLVWFGATSAAGWAVAALPPGRAAELAREARRRIERHPLWRGARPWIVRIRRAVRRRCATGA
jgi:hypothetical protein